MTGGTVDYSSNMDLQQTEMFGANYAGGNHHIVALSKNDLSFLSIKGEGERMSNILLIEQIIPTDI